MYVYVAASLARLHWMRAAVHMHAGVGQKRTIISSTQTAAWIPLRSGAGAFSGTPLEAWLRDAGVCNLMLAGRNAATVINTTMRQASDRGFDTLIVADCVHASHPADLYGVTASIIRGSIFSATAHSDAVHQWLEKPKRGGGSGGSSKRPRDE